METDKIETTVTEVASKGGMGGGATTSLLGWMTSNEAVVLTGLLVTVLGFAINLYFQIRRDRREQELQRIRLASIMQGKVLDSNDGDN